jgi:hypothetical protein
LGEYSPSRGEKCKQQQVRWRRVEFHRTNLSDNWSEGSPHANEQASTIA